MRAARRRFERGMTLAELVISAGAAAVLLSGVASALVLVSRALPEQGTPLNAYAAAADVVEQMTTELLCARSVLANSATEIEFTVADRDDDSSDETIRYEWSGTGGDPLLRTYNSGAAVAVLDDVQGFELAYDHLEILDLDGTVTSDTGEIELRSYDASSDLSELKIEHDDKYWGQSFIPILPDGSVGWSITHVWFKAKWDGKLDGLVLVKLYQTDADLRPTGSLLGEYSLPESMLSDSFQWYGFTFDVTGLEPDEGVCIVLEQGASGVSAKVQYCKNDVSLPNAALFKYDHDEWQAAITNKALLFAVYGHALVVDPDVEPTTQGISGVHIKVLAGQGATDPVTTSVRLLNVPEGS